MPYFSHVFALKLNCRKTCLGWCGHNQFDFYFTFKPGYPAYVTTMCVKTIFDVPNKRKGI